MKNRTHRPARIVPSSSSRLEVRRFGPLTRYMMATLLALLATTSLAYAEWSTVTCADGEKMCCWVENGTESNCHEGPCHSLQGGSETDEIEEIETRRGPEANESREMRQRDTKAETAAKKNAAFQALFIEVESEDDDVFCIDLRTMRAHNGPCPEAAP